jgi:hypothetical protein
MNVILLDFIHTFTPVSFSSTSLFRTDGHSIRKLRTVKSGRRVEKICMKLSRFSCSGYGNFWTENCKKESYLLKLTYLQHANITFTLQTIAFPLHLSMLVPCYNVGGYNRQTQHYIFERIYYNAVAWYGSCKICYRRGPLC